MNYSGLQTAIPYVISLSAVMGTFYGILHTNRVNAQLQEQRLKSEERVRSRDMLRDKGEELYMLADKFERDFRHVIGEIVKPLLVGDRKNALTQANLNECITALLRMKMLTKVYFPYALSDFTKIEMAVSKRSEVLASLTRSIDEAAMSRVTQQLLLIGGAVSEGVEGLQKSVIEVLASLHSDIASAIPSLTTEHPVNGSEHSRT